MIEFLVSVKSGRYDHLAEFPAVTLGFADTGGASLQQWRWSVPLRNSTNQMGELFRKIERLTKLGVHRDWPAHGSAPFRRDRR